METTEHISYVVSFMAGFLMFFSPCLLPLIPSYLSYLTGVSFRELSGESGADEKKQIRRQTILHSLCFIGGFSIIFILLGMTVTALGAVLIRYQEIFKKAGGVFIIFFGLVIMGVFRIGLLEKERKITYRKTNVSYIGSMLVGATFAFAWTPCVGPILGSVLVYASTTGSFKLGLSLLAAFSIGLAIPFFLSGLAINSFLIHFNKIKPHLKKINVLAGIILILFGLKILIGG